MYCSQLKMHIVTPKANVKKYNKKKYREKVKKWIKTNSKIADLNPTIMIIKCELTKQSLQRGWGSQWIKKTRSLPSLLLGIYPKWKCWSNDNPMFNFLKNCYTFFHSTYTILHSHRKFTRVPISAHPHDHLLFSMLDMKWYSLWFWFPFP